LLKPVRAPGGIIAAENLSNLESKAMRQTYIGRVKIKEGVDVILKSTKRLAGQIDINGNRWGSGHQKQR
jgi:hypothetical protein